LLYVSGENPLDEREVEYTVHLPFIFWSDPPPPPQPLTIGFVPCRNRYVSTVTNSQNMVGKEGIFGGPRRVDDYVKKFSQSASSSFVLENPEYQMILPWSNLGKTVETILESRIVFPSKVRQKLYKASMTIRGWSLPDFWEQSTWPKDSSGSGQTRFGMPVIADPDDDDDDDALAYGSVRPGRAVTTPGGRRFSAYEQEEEEEEWKSLPPPKPKQDNPFIQQVAGVHGIQTEIMDTQLDCILFLSAKFCKTCQQINPQYTRMARMSQEDGSSRPSDDDNADDDDRTNINPGIVYAKVETSGRWGKEVGRYLGVDAVPNFVLFRKGKRFGSPLSVSKLPSKKIDKAIQLLLSGSEWDPSILRTEDEKKA